MRIFLTLDVVVVAVGLRKRHIDKAVTIVAVVVFIIIAVVKVVTVVNIVTIGDPPTASVNIDDYRESVLDVTDFRGR